MKKKEPQLVNFLYRTLYDITLDKNFMLYVNLKDEKTNVVVEIPEIWRVVNKDSYSKFGISENTSFLFLTPHNENISIVCDGKCSKEQFEDAYKLNVENMKKNGVIIEAEYQIRGLRNVNQAIVQVQSNGNKIRIFQNYLIVNDFLFNIAWQVPNDIALEDILKVENNSFKGQLIWKLKAENAEMVKPGINNMSNTIQQKVITNKDAISMVAEYNAILEQAKSELKGSGITETFVKNIERLSRYIIKESNQDPFWSDMSRQIFVILVTVNLINNTEFVLLDLKEQVKESEKIKELINGNYEKINVPELAQFINSIKVVNNPNGNKTFLSILDIISKNLVVLCEDTRVKINDNQSVNKNNGSIAKKEELMKEYSQEIKGLPTFKFLFPESMGEYSKFNDNVFELKKDGLQKIRVMISKCSSESNFEKDAKAWIEKNKTDAKMEDVSYKKEKIGKYPIETYELQRIGTTSVRIYKIGYVNNCRITISGRKIGKKEEIINQAFETLTWEENSEIMQKENKVEHKEECKVSKAIILNCPVCKNEFKLNWNVPASDKIFYCKCPNCNAEIKSENPNYKG